MRIVFLLTSLLFAACTVGDTGSTTNTGTGPDAGGGGSGGSNNGSGGNANACVNPATPAGNHLHAGGGTDNAGKNCLVAGCHLANNPGTGAPGFEFAGTLYKAGTTPLQPYPGVTIQIKSGTQTLTAVTDTGGNFSFAAGSLQGTFTATADATACPAFMKMSMQLMSSGDPGANSCNSCHVPGGTTAPIAL